MNNWEALILDFDNVLVMSEEVKVRVFQKIYEPFGPEIVRRVIEHHRQHFGVSRFLKFHHYHEHFLKKPLDEATETMFKERFSSMVEDGVVAAPWPDGVRDFLDHWSKRLPVFIVSGTPQDELRRIVARRGMDHYFVAVSGIPDTKTVNIRRLLEKHKLEKEHVLFVGDAKVDYDAAGETGVQFMGFGAGESRPFPGRFVTDFKALAEWLESKEAVHEHNR